MSDFDKEAEREKLREKYEKEEQRREATEQMSELLLKGATMTNAHCSDCGDPIFRYDGQEFCPTCEKPVDRGGDAAGEAGEDGENGAAGDDNVEVASPSDDARVRFGGEGETHEESADDVANVADETPSETVQSAAPDAENQPRQPTRSAPSLNPSDETRVEDRTEPDAPSAGTPATSTAGSDVASTIASARASLARTAARFAQAAEGTDDPTVAREHLEAAREAAAALDELD